MTKSAILTVSDLNKSARLLLEENFGSAWIRGEISNYHQPASGHWYFTLKDDGAQVRCAMFVHRNRHSRMQPKEGAEVLLHGRVSLYEGRGEFQIIVEHMEAAGEGALRAAYEALKAQLAAEGLFAAERKRPLPKFPRHLAVISSSSGAALKDVLSVVGRRFPALQVTVLPTTVQGLAAEGQIVQALAQAEGIEPDLILLTRGGGSLEDLAPFNSERTARAIARCPVPTVSAIGHEVDFTIADFVADLRAPTPSAAAEMITPDTQALAEDLSSWRQRLTFAASNRLQLYRHQLTGLHSRLDNPLRRLQQMMQRVDDLEERLHRGLNHRLERLRSRFDGASQRLGLLHPSLRIKGRNATIHAIGANMRRLMNAKLKQDQDRLQALARTLEAVSPLNALRRGFAIITNQTGEVRIRAEQVEVGDCIDLNFFDGAIKAQAQGQRPLPERWQVQSDEQAKGKPT